MPRPESKQHFKAILERFSKDYEKRVDYWRNAKRNDEDQQSVQRARDRADEVDEERQNWIDKYEKLYHSLPDE